MRIPLPLRISFCILSGIGVGMIGTYGILGYDEDLGIYGVSGLLFAAAVLFPCLKQDRRIWLRAPALVLASALSYYCAVWLTGELVSDAYLWDWVSFTIGSVVGAAIVVVAFVLVTPARLSRRFLSFGLAAGLIGGPITRFTLPDLGVILAVTGHAIWHMFILLAIYYGTRTSQP